MKKILCILSTLLPICLVSLDSSAKIDIKDTQKMEYKHLGNQYFIRINPNQPLISTLKEFCLAKNITLGTISGIGSLKSATLAFFNPETKKYQEKTFKEPLEMANLIGNITMKGNEPILHLHTTLAGDNYKALAGHLVEAKISLTAEVVIEPVKGKIEKAFDKETGLNLMNFEPKAEKIKKTVSKKPIKK